MATPIDHEALAESRLATEFRESANLIAYIKALLSEADTLEQVFQDIIDSRWIDTAEGVNLDIIGAIVGQTRSFIDAEIFEYFGFSPLVTAQSFGSVADAGVGGRFVSVDESPTGVRQLTDEEYRLFIRAKIIRNSTTSAPEEVIAQIVGLFSPDQVVLTEGSYASYSVSIGKRLTLNEKVVLNDTDIIPKTAGVQVSYVSEFDAGESFSFSGVAGGKGFGSVNDPLTGGTFANLI